MTAFLLAAFILLAFTLAALLWPWLAGRAVRESAAGRVSPLLWASIAVFVVAVPVAMYLWRGTPQALDPAAMAAAAAAAGEGAGHEISPEKVNQMVGQLEDHLKQQPDDANGWVMLARSYNFLQKFDLSARAYAEAQKRVPDDAQLLSDEADALAMAQGRKLGGEPLALLQRALKLDPANLKALALVGTEAFDRSDYRAAVDYWTRAQAASAQQPEFGRMLEASIAEARKRGGLGDAPVVAAGAPAAAKAGAAAAPAAGSSPPAGAHASLSGRITLAPALADAVGPDDTVFVFARAAQGPKMPVALLRRQVRDLPLDFTLDDSMAMMPDMSLAQFPNVVVGARISRTGDALAHPGDLQGFSAPVSVGARGVNIEIHDRVP